MYFVVSFMGIIIFVRQICFKQQHVPYVAIQRNN